MKRGQSWMFLVQNRRLGRLEDSNIPCSHQSKKNLHAVFSAKICMKAAAKSKLETIVLIVTPNRTYHPVRNHAMHLSSISTGWTLRCFL